MFQSSAAEVIPHPITHILQVEEKLFFLQNLIPQNASRGPPWQQFMFRVCSERSCPCCLLQGLVAWAAAGQPLAAVPGYVALSVPH